MKPDSDWLQEIKWTEEGLVPVVAQDAESGKVLMLAWMNRQALQQTMAEGYAIYWSRSRKRLWRKGEQSGHTQEIREIRLDCDGDTLLIKVMQRGGIACHTGRAHCFYRVFRDQDGWQSVDPVIRNPEDIYES